MLAKQDGLNIYKSEWIECLLNIPRIVRMYFRQDWPPPLAPALSKVLLKFFKNMPKAQIWCHIISSWIPPILSHPCILGSQDF